jgi:hypothetical protein
MVIVDGAVELIGSKGKNGINKKRELCKLRQEIPLVLFE